MFESDAYLALDPEDELQAGVIITRGGAVVHPALLPPAPAAAGPDSTGEEEYSESGQQAGSAEGIVQ